MTKHDLRLVRMNRDDGTLHCDVHGLLSSEEANEVLERSGLTSDVIATAESRVPRWVTAFWELVARLGRPRCFENYYETVYDIGKRYLH